MCGSESVVDDVELIELRGGSFVRSAVAGWLPCPQIAKPIAGDDHGHDCSHRRAEFYVFGSINSQLGSHPGCGETIRILVPEVPGVGRNPDQLTLRVRPIESQ